MSILIILSSWAVVNVGRGESLRQWTLIYTKMQSRATLRALRIFKVTRGSSSPNSGVTISAVLPQQSLRWFCSHLQNSTYLQMALLIYPLFPWAKAISENLRAHLNSLFPLSPSRRSSLVITTKLYWGGKWVICQFTHCTVCHSLNFYFITLTLLHNLKGSALNADIRGFPHFINAIINLSSGQALTQRFLHERVFWELVSGRAAAELDKTKEKACPISPQILSHE